MRARISMLPLLAMMLIGLPAMGEQGSGARGDPAFYILEYRPGKNWNGRVNFADQPGIRAHKDYLAELFASDIVRMAGEIDSGPGAIVLLRVGSREQAAAVAERDPAVINQILEVDVIGWRVEMSSLRHQRRSQEPVIDPDQPFRIESLDPDAPINLKNQIPDHPRERPHDSPGNP